MSVENVASLDAWVPSIIAFGVVAGAINGIMTALKKSLKNTKIDSASWYPRVLPLLPPLIGAGFAPFIGANITPIEFDLSVRIAAGLLMGALSTNIYAVWEQNVKKVSAPGESGDHTVEL